MPIQHNALHPLRFSDARRRWQEIVRLAATASQTEIAANIGSSAGGDCPCLLSDDYEVRPILDRIARSTTDDAF